MKLSKLIENCKTDSICADLDLDIGGVSYDTRTLRAGDLFVAVVGLDVDGHMFIKKAVDNGASCIVCQRPPTIETPYILVSDARKALAAISATWFNNPTKKLKMIGVTGTNGKTSVTYIVKKIIEECTGEKVGLIGTNGNFIGERQLHTELTTPESFELQKLLDKMVFEECKFVVMEVSSHALTLCRVYGITYDIGVFTNLSPEHLDFHGTMSNYANAKAMLFCNSKVSIINSDDEYAGLMLSKAANEHLTYAISDKTANLVGEKIDLSSDSVKFTAMQDGSETEYNLQIPGLFSVYNALAAIAVSSALGFDHDKVKSALMRVSGVKGRAEIVPTGYDFTILIDYAHTPDALENIISAARGFCKGKLYTIFGCGGDRDKSKRPLMGNIATSLSDFVIVTSDNPRTEEPQSIINEILGGIDKACDNYTVVENRAVAIAYAIDRLDGDDILIIAGKGHETYQILGSEKTHFDDREVVAEHLSKKKSQTRKDSKFNLE